MTDNEKWEVLSAKIASLRADVHRFWEASKRDHEAGSRLFTACRKDGDPLAARMADLTRKNFLLDKIIVARGLNSLEG